MPVVFLQSQGVSQNGIKLQDATYSKVDARGVKTLLARKGRVVSRSVAKQFLDDGLLSARDAAAVREALGAGAAKTKGEGAEERRVKVVEPSDDVVVDADAPQTAEDASDEPQESSSYQTPEVDLSGTVGDVVARVGDDAALAAAYLAAEQEGRGRVTLIRQLSEIAGEAD